MKSRVEIMAEYISVCSNSSSSKFFLTLIYIVHVVHHVAEDASESAFIKCPGADEIVTGSSQNFAYMYISHYACYEVMTSGF